MLIWGSRPCLLEILVLYPFRLLQFCPVSFTIKGRFWISFDQFRNRLSAAPAVMALCLDDMAVLPCFISILFLPPRAGPPSGLSRLFSISPPSITLSKLLVCKAEPRPRGSRGSWGSSSSSSSLSAPKSLELPEVNDPFLKDTEKKVRTQTHHLHSQFSVNVVVVFQVGCRITQGRGEQILELIYCINFCF